MSLAFRLSRVSISPRWNIPKVPIILSQRYTSHANKARHGKRLQQWTPEEVSQYLQEVEDVVASGGAPQIKALSQLLVPIRHFQDSPALTRLLATVRKAGLPIQGGLASSLVAGLAEMGLSQDMRTVLGEMRGQLRVQGLVAVLLLSCREGDVSLARQFLNQWDQVQPLPARLAVQLLLLSQASREPAILHAVLEILRFTRQSVEAQLADAIRQWATGNEGLFSCEETTISHSGHCARCGQCLERGLSEEHHYELLQAMATAINTEGLGFSPELISNLSRLDQSLAGTATPYTAVVDGLNVSHNTSQGFSTVQVMDTVNQLVNAVGSPVLVVARKHLASAMDDLPAFSNFVPGPQDFHVFTTHVNEISDDVCVIYATLATSSNCYFVSNDFMSDYASRLSLEHGRMFRSWQSTRQITLDSRKMHLLFPPDHSRLVQPTGDGWHLPLQQGAQEADWMREGRRRDFAGEPLNPQAWLCLKSASALTQ